MKGSYFLLTGIFILFLSLGCSGGGGGGSSLPVTPLPTIKDSMANIQGTWDLEWTGEQTLIYEDGYQEDEEWTITKDDGFFFIIYPQKIVGWFGDYGVADGHEGQWSYSASSSTFYFRFDMNFNSEDEDGKYKEHDIATFIAQVSAGDDVAFITGNAVGEGTNSYFDGTADKWTGTGNYTGTMTKR